MFNSMILFNLLPWMMFLLIFGVIITDIIRRAAQWNKNNKAPRLAVDASVVGKRTSTKNHTHANAGDVTGMHGYNTSSSTIYYITFQVESGDRMEFQVEGAEYGMIVEGDSGKLYFQGSRYLNFIRG